jgi:hypothetical protein
MQNEFWPLRGIPFWIDPTKPEPLFTRIGDSAVWVSHPHDSRSHVGKSAESFIAMVRVFCGNRARKLFQFNRCRIAATLAQGQLPLSIKLLPSQSLKVCMQSGKFSRVGVSFL